MRELLGRETVDVNAPDNDGSTPLIYASRSGQFEVVQTLLNASSINTNAVDKNGSTPLMLASARGHSDVVKLLLRCSDVDKTKREDNTKNALDLTEGENSETIGYHDQTLQGQDDTCQSTISSEQEVLDR